MSLPPHPGNLRLWPDRRAPSGHTVYVSGPMRGLPRQNWPEFFRAEAELRWHGWDVVNPARLDAEDAASSRDVLEYARRDLDALLQSDAIYMLPGWEDSVGARAEHAVAEWIGLAVLYEEEAP